jgi:hypothetical protein
MSPAMTDASYREDNKAFAIIFDPREDTEALVQSLRADAKWLRETLRKFQGQRPAETMS